MPPLDLRPPNDDGDDCMVPLHSPTSVKDLLDACDLYKKESKEWVLGPLPFGEPEGERSILHPGHDIEQPDPNNEGIDCSSALPEQKENESDQQTTTLQLNVVESTSEETDSTLSSSTVESEASELSLQLVQSFEETIYCTTSEIQSCLRRKNDSFPEIDIDHHQERLSAALIISPNSDAIEVKRVPDHRGVHFQHEIVDKVWTKPRLSRRERSNLFYSRDEIEWFRIEKRHERYERALAAQYKGLPCCFCSTPFKLGKS